MFCITSLSYYTVTTRQLCTLLQILFFMKDQNIKAGCHIVRNRILDGTIKTFYVATRNQLADVFTKAHGVYNFLRPLRKLGIINSFAQNIKYPEYMKHKQEAINSQEPRALLLRGSIKTD